jgi:hypothetical protein
MSPTDAATRIVSGSSSVHAPVCGSFVTPYAVRPA